MSGREDSRQRQMVGRTSIVGELSKTTPAAKVVEDGGGGNVVERAGLEQLRTDADDARRQRSLLATKVALLAYKLQMNSQERRRHNHYHHQLCQARLCGRLV